MKTEKCFEQKQVEQTFFRFTTSGSQTQKNRNAWRVVTLFITSHNSPDISYKKQNVFRLLYDIKTFMRDVTS